MSVSTTEILEKVRALIDKPEKWTKDTLARNIEGTPTFTSSGDAVSFCIIGAICKAKNLEPDFFYVQSLLDEFVPPEYTGFAKLIKFNNDEKTTHQDLMELFDKAIAAEKEKGTL